MRAPVLTFRRRLLGYWVDVDYGDGSSERFGVVGRTGPGQWSARRLAPDGLPHDVSLEARTRYGAGLEVLRASGWTVRDGEAVRT